MSRAVLLPHLTRMEVPASLLPEIVTPLIFSEVLMRSSPATGLMVSDVGATVSIRTVLETGVETFPAVSVLVIEMEEELSAGISAAV